MFYLRLGKNKIKRIESGTTNTTSDDRERFKGENYVCLLYYVNDRKP